MTDFKQFSMYDNVPIEVVGTTSFKYRRRVYVVWCEFGSIDIYGYPTPWLLGVFETKRDAVAALENMSDECRIIGWHGGGGSRWKFYRRLDDGTDRQVTANDMVEWGVIPIDETDWGWEDPEFFIEERELGALSSLRLEA